MVQAEEKKVPVPIDELGVIGGVHIAVKRDDLLLPEVSGNKWYKLVYHVEAAQKKHAKGIATFGGAYSNHLLATAAYCHALGLKSIGIVRGEEVVPLNPTLSRCLELGMHLVYVSRSDYRKKEDQDYLETLRQAYPSYHFVPEGGGGWDGIRGAQLLLDKRCQAYDLIVSAVGTGTTIAGMALASKPHQKLWGIPVHKHSKVVDELASTIPQLQLPNRLEAERFTSYHFGGYAKWTDELIDFIRTINGTYGLPLDPIYTGKAFYALLDQIEQGLVPAGRKVLFIHTGGLQGNAGFEQRFGVKLSNPDPKT